MEQEKSIKQEHAKASTPKYLGFEDSFKPLPKEIREFLESEKVFQRLDKVKSCRRYI